MNEKLNQSNPEELNPYEVGGGPGSGLDKKVVDSETGDQMIVEPDEIKVTDSGDADFNEAIGIIKEQEEKLLEVDFASIDNSAIPKEGRHFAATKEAASEVAKELEFLGYQSEMIFSQAEEIGLIVEKGKSKFIFIYPQEKPQEKK